MKNNQIFCCNCGHEGKAKKGTPGSLLIEILLWFMMLVPGLIYSIWRMSSKFQKCPHCNSKNILPSDSPIAKQIKNNMSIAKYE